MPTGGGALNWRKVLLAATTTGAIIFALVVFLGVIGLFRSSTGASALAEDFVFFLAEENYGSAYALTSLQFQEAASEEDLRTFVTDYSVIDQVERIEITSRGFQNDLHYIAGTISSESETSPIYMEFVKEEGQLRILYVSLDPQDLPNFSEER